MPPTLSIAVCISEEVTLSDFVTPMEILAGLEHPMMGADTGELAYTLTFDYLAPTLDPLVSVMGRKLPAVVPTLTYAEAGASGKQFDIIWVPAGPLPDKIPQEEIAFIAQQAPKAKYILSVCFGAVQLALAGVLAGKRATTNKFGYRLVTAATPKDIEWVPKARWVVNGNVWTSSGITAGNDMALAFVEHLVGPKAARAVRGVAEIPEVTAADDPFAAFHGLV
ncbi:class I glutamine amidotransferase-like protein [Mycena albidolilacea]|uniref:Class I glutamine amidotransferase-like protein n=1 Tax=Mycena albidolilacea TaxID=1033008 RepID=A0AAD7ATC4_9AGAR|nr:class I glutamine amidotransferase-like protein [Mycena albidolilacea]